MSFVWHKRRDKFPHNPFTPKTISTPKNPTNYEIVPFILDTLYRSNTNDNQHVLDISLTMSKAWTTHPPTHSTSQFPLDTFSPIVKPTTIWVILSLTLSKGWPFQQLDVNNIFLHRHLFKDVYMVQPQASLIKIFPTMCHLCKALYGLKQAPRAWYIELQPFLMATSFVNSHSSTSLFVYNTNDLFLYLLIYVDDLILIGNDLGFINKFVCHLPYNSPLRTLAHSLSSLELRWSHLKMVSFFLNRSTLLSSSLGPTWWMLKKSKHLSH